MAKNDDQKLFWVWAQLEEELHTALLEIGTMTGKHPKSLIEAAIEEYIINWVQQRTAKGDKIPGNIQIESIMLQDRRRQIMMTQVRQLAYNHVKAPTDDSAEQLAKTCDLAGISVEAILEEVGERPHVLELMSEHGTLSNVESFLVELMTPGEMYSARDIIDEAERNGFKKYLVNEAKRKLGIRSFRRSEGWYWHFDEVIGTQVQEEDQSVF